MYSFWSKYSIEQQLGAGGSATVVSAKRKNDDSRVAIKILPRSSVPANRVVIDKDPTGLVIPIPLEAYILRRLKHPGIIKIIDFAQDSQNFYIVTEHFGHSWSRASSFSLASAPADLFECIEAHGPFSESQSLNILAQLLDVLSYLKSMNVYHCDIKDENILVDSNFNIKLIDFGSAEIVLPSDSKKLNTFRGTVAFAPPEVFQNKNFIPEAADLWACGTLLYTMLYGQNLFANADQILSNTPNPLVRRDIVLSSEISSILNSMLHRDAQYRTNLEDAKLAVKNALEQNVIMVELSHINN